MVGYMLYSLTVSVYKHYQIQQHIKDYEQRNAQLELQNSQKIEDFQYYTSDQYREKIAKQSLGLVNPGEKVIVLTPAASNPFLDEEDDYFDSRIPLQKRYSDLPNYMKWWKFFFEDNQFRP